MSNLLAVRADSNRAAAVEAWLGQQADATDVAVVELGAGARLFLVSAGVERSLRREQSVLFRGFAVDTERATIAIGADGWLDAPAALRDDPWSLGGTFAMVRWHEGAVDVSRDLWGNQTMLRTDGAGWSAACDSMLVLRRLRDALGEPSTPDERELLARTALSGIAQTAFGAGTSLQQIAFVPNGCSVRLDAHGATTVGRPVTAVLQQRAGDYRSTVRAAAEGIAGEIGAILSLDATTPRLRISGGQDSRVVLAAALALGRSELPQLVVQDQAETHREDAKVAASLARRFGLELQTMRPIDVDYAGQLELWLATLAGTYDGFGIDADAQVDGVFGISGIGAETYKGNFGWRSWWQLRQDLDLPLQLELAFLEQTDRGLAAIGVQPSQDDATESHYLAHRAGVHCGAGYVGLSPLTANPLQRADLVRLGRTPWSDDPQIPGPERRHVGHPLMVADLAALLHPEAAAHAYERDVGVDAALVEQRLSTLGGPVDVVGSAFAVHGSPASVPLGPSSLARRLAAAEAPGDFTFEAVEALGRRGIDRLQASPVRERYLEVLENASWRAEERALPLMFAGQSPARFASLALLG
ncbi:hypothetical protein [Agrococcus sp. ARC_14]|uniref:hypothetical protein n=1 Tax=Agrococcus sp. ARC_14 TaxID=2919927 RepID=UPI001F05E023|nr:hypothetical protein [Agrococcus sp. ARC_14]MCH1882337.1 hypothetical protein [Agrococcus sp. ARC_14]